MLFDTTIRNLGRGREIIKVLLKYGFEDLVINTPLSRLIPRGRKLRWVRHDRPVFEFSRYERIRMAAEDLGPTFVKLAQVLSNRPDVLPEEMIIEFEKLQANVPPFDPAEARSIVERALDKPMEEVYSHFDEEVLGSASIGQVHRATMVDGTEVVIKVRRPGIRRTIERDLSIINEVVRLGNNYFERMGVTNLPDVIRAFERTIKEELDYGHEARNMEQFRHFYRKESNFFVPKVFKKLSTERTLTIEYVEGTKITDLEKLREWNVDPAKIAETGMDVYLRQIFEFGYFHADPHPGNILVTPKGKLCLIDFGMVGNLMKKDKYAFAGIFIGMAQKDPVKMASSLLKLSLDDEVSDTRLLEYDLNELIEDYASLEVAESSMAELIISLQKVIYDYNMRIPGTIFLILRALSILDGIGKKIHPDFKTFDFIQPYGARLIREQIAPRQLWEEAAFRISQFDHLFRNFPGEFNQIVKQVRKGRIQVNVMNHGYEPLLRKSDSVINRLNLTLLIVALLITSAMMMLADLSPGLQTSGGIPYFSIVGFVFAGMISMVLFWRTLRNW